MAKTSRKRRRSKSRRRRVEPAASAAKGLSRRRRHRLWKSWGIFLTVIGAAVALRALWPGWYTLTIPLWTAKSVGWALNAVGQDAVVNGTIVSCSKCHFEIIGECTGYFPAAIFLAAVLASPATLRSKLLGLGLGVPVLFLVNLARLVVLCFLFTSYPQAFEMLHILVWQSLMIFFTILLWMVWFVTLARRP